MGLIRRPARYDEPISNPFTDPVYEFFGGVDLRERKRRERRAARNRWMAWWYHHSHPWLGLRAASIVVAIVLIAVLLVRNHIVGARLCLTDVVCVFTRDGSITAAPAGSAPTVPRP